MRSRVVLLALVPLGVLAACGGSGSGSTATSTASAPSTAAATTTVSTAPSTEAPTTEATTTTIAPTTTDGIEMDKLPGRILIQAIGCGSKLDASDMAKLTGTKNVEEVLAAMRDMENLSLVSQICVMNPDGSGMVLVSPADTEAESPGWIDGGERVIFRMNHEWHVVNPDGTNLQPWTDPTKLMWRLSPDGTQYINESLHDPRVYLTPVGQKRKGPGRRPILNDVFGATFVWSPDGRSVLFNKGPGQCPAVWKIDVATLEESAITGPESPNGAKLCALANQQSWSPDGSTILVVDNDGLQSDTHPYLVDPDGSNLRPLVNERLFDDPEWFTEEAAWSPDGKYIFIDVISTEAFIKQAPTRLVVRVKDGLIRPTPFSRMLTIIDVMWAPEAPELNPIPDEDMDRVR